MRRAALVAVAMTVAPLGCRDRPPAPPAPVRLSMPVLDGVDAGPLDAAIAPDDSGIVFVATSGGTTQLWRRTFADEAAQPLEGTEGAQLPAWKQTGDAVSFFAGGRLKYIALSDGRVGDLAAAPSPGGASWLRDGSLLFSPDVSGPIQRLLNGQVRAATTLTTGDTGHAFPVARTASDDFVYVAIRSDGRRRVRLVRSDGERELTTTSSHAAILGDVLLHVDDGVLVAYRFDSETARLPGRGIPVALDVGVSETGRGLFASSSSLLLHAPAVPRSREVAWLDAAGNRLRLIGDAGDHWQVRLSPDDREAALTTLDPLLRTVDVFIVPTTGTGAPERLTLSLAADMDPVWSPDGTRVLFRSMQNGMANLFVRRTHTRGAPDEPLVKSTLNETPTDWHANGQILFSSRGKGSVDVFAHHVGRDGVTPVVASPFNESDARSSPDGRWLAYVSDESGQADVYVQDAGAQRQRVSFGGGTRPRWSRDSRTLFFVRGAQLLRTTLAADGRTFANAQAAFEVPGIVDFDAAHRSDRFVVVRDVRSVAETPVNVILNWRTIVEQGEGGSQ